MSISKRRPRVDDYHGHSMGTIAMNVELLKLSIKLSITHQIKTHEKYWIQ